MSITRIATSLPADARLWYFKGSAWEQPMDVPGDPAPTGKMCLWAPGEGEGPMMTDVLVMRQDRVTYKGAMAAINAGIAKAEELELTATISVVDISGGIVAVARMDGPGASTVQAATGKATYSGTRGRSTAEFIESRLKHDDVLFRAVSQNPATFLVPGGYPLMAGGRCVGGVGVSGGKYQDDVKVAEAAVAGFDAALEQANAQD
jgi:uncharacterized protein GlcG (DUF336 family)